MLETGNWTIGLGRFGKIRVRLHILFLLFAAVGILLTQQLVPRQDSDGMVENTLLLFGLLFVSVLLHEFGHIQAALKLGGSVERIVIGPLGGLEPPKVHPSPRNILLLALAGPAVNFSVCAIVMLVLWMTGRVDMAGLINVFEPQDLTVGVSWERILRMTFWVNMLLLLVNVLPAFPFDGKRIFTAGLALLWREENFQRSAVFVSVLCKSCAVVFFFLAWIMKNESFYFPGFPAWFGFVVFGVFLFFSADRDANETNPEPETEATETSVFDWLEKYQHEKEKQIRIEAEEEEQMERILIRLHQEGHDSLSEEDMALLQRVSERYRRRLKATMND